MADYAPQVADPGSRGQDARYDTTNTWYDPSTGLFTDGVYHYREQGTDVLSEDRPSVATGSLPLADAHDAGGGYGGGGGGGGGNPMDAYTRQLQSLLDSQSAAQRADTRAAIQQALIGYGVVPQGFKDELGALDDTTRALIQKNTDTGISGYARLLEGKNDRQRQMLAMLSNKGLRRSGAKGYLGRRAQLDWDRQSTDATAALLQDVGGKQRAFADAEQGRKMQMLQALFSQQFSSPFRGQTLGATRVNAQNVDPMQQAINYWQSNPAPTYVSPTSGKQWYGGVNGVESTQFKGKALDSLMGR